MAARKLACTYLLCQAVGIVIWWLILLRGDPWLLSVFFREDVHPAILHKFLVPDLLILGGLSATSAVLGFSGHRNRAIAVWMTCGAAGYALAGAIAVNWPIGTRPAADLLMIATMVGTVLAARAVALP